MVDVGDSDSSGRCYALSLQHLLNAHYLLLGLCTGVVGPSLLDLADVYGTDVTTIASSKIAVAVGGIVGAVGAYFAMSLLSRHKLAVMSVLVAAAGGATALMPMLGMVWLLMADMAVRGAANSALHAGARGGIVVMRVDPEKFHLRKQAATSSAWKPGEVAMVAPTCTSCISVSPSAPSWPRSWSSPSWAAPSKSPAPTAAPTAAAAAAAAA